MTTEPIASLTHAQRAEVFDAGRHLGLDAIRGLAILLILFHHVALRFPGAVGDPFSRYLRLIGWAGVDVFFAISGFLITRILLRSSTSAQIGEFFRRRLFRIVPLYALALVVFALASVVTRYEIENVSRLWIAILFLTGWAIPFLGENGVPYTISWSLSVEEFAYVLFGMLSLLGRRRLLWALGASALLALLVRLLMVHALSFAPGPVYYFPPARLDAIALGGAFAAFPHVTRHFTRSHWLVPMLVTIVVIGLLAGVGRHNALVATFGYSAIAFSAAWLIACVSRLEPHPESILVRVAARFGLVSYFVYLFHGFVIAGVAVACSKLGIVNANIYLLVGVVLLLTYLPAQISWKYIETPLIRWGRRKQPHIKPRTVSELPS